VFHFITRSAKRDFREERGNFYTRKCRLFSVFSSWRFYTSPQAGTQGNLRIYLPSFKLGINKFKAVFELISDPLLRERAHFFKNSESLFIKLFNIYQHASTIPVCEILSVDHFFHKWDPDSLNPDPEFQVNPDPITKFKKAEILQTYVKI
jgi:hypothetical protein